MGEVVQLDLLEWKKPEPRFDGETYDHDRDHSRLAFQLSVVFEALKDGAWRSPAEICDAAQCDWASASARVRDLRKSKFGGHTVERRYVKDGLFEYRLIVNRSAT